MSEQAPSMMIEFSPPIEWNGGTYDAIELREPKAVEVLKAQAELKGTADSTMKFGVALICAIAGKPRQVIEQMPISKLMAGIDYLTGFLDGGLQTGVS